MWDLPGPGIKPVSPALAGGFLTTAPPGKPTPYYLFDAVVSVMISPNLAILIGKFISLFFVGITDIFAFICTPSFWASCFCWVLSPYLFSCCLLGCSFSFPLFHVFPILLVVKLVLFFFSFSQTLEVFLNFLLKLYHMYVNLKLLSFPLLPVEYFKLLTTLHACHFAQHFCSIFS